MNDKDITQKTLEGFNDVFADIVNVLLFDGKQVVHPSQLVDKATHSQLKNGGRIRNQERDVAKIWNGAGSIRIAFLGIENQTNPDADMALRVIGYDGAAYREQLSFPKKEKLRYPVITLVLYFGYKRRWKKGKSLLERLQVPEELKPFVNDYKLNLFEIAYLDEETVKLFKSDFRIIADYCVKMRKYGDYSPPSDIIKHPRELLATMTALTNDKRFDEAWELFDDEERRDGVDMCEALDKLIARGEAIGQKRGETIGQKRGEAIGQKRGENALASLMTKLFESGRVKDAERAAKDSSFRQELYKEFNIAF